MLQFIFVLSLSAALLACSGKPADTNAASGSEAQQSPAVAATATNAGAPAPTMSQTMKSATSSAPEMIMVPKGKTIVVRLNSAVGSKISHAGDSFTATVAEPVMADGKTAIPSGATATGIVADAKPLGRFKGGALLSLRLNSININGKSYSIETAPVTRTLKGKGKRTAVAIGGGAGLGALIGGLAGGGKGAAIGAAAGAGAGTAGAGLTGNKEIVLPAETAVTFRLTEMLHIM